MEKLSEHRLKDIIEYEDESSYIDFKQVQYIKNKNKDKDMYQELIKDIMAMANSDYLGDKYIIIGIKDIKGQKKQVIGIEEAIIDDADYQQLINENIEPEIKFSYLSGRIDNKVIPYFVIYDNLDKPYMMKKKYKNLERGDSYKRIGSSCIKLDRRDYDNIYSSKHLDVKSVKLKALKSELKLIQILKSENNYLINQNNIVSAEISSYKKCITESRWSIRNIPSGMSESQWKYETLNKLINFSVKEIEKNLINELIKNIDIEYSEKYINILTSIESGYAYLCDLQKKLYRLIEKKQYEIDSSIMLINTNHIYDNFSEGYFSRISLFNYKKRIDEINKAITEFK